ncbi:GDP-L-fucose synthase [uncultured archaeon]|nr:GDP-L-fucose synthase [uncultured archaeon]
MSFWKGKQILVTGGAGFLGHFVVEELKRKGAKDIFVPRSKEFDLRKRENCAKVVKGIDIVFHLAASVGGIGANMNNPGKFFYDNAIMGIQLMEEARLAGVKKFVTVGTVCAYPKFTPVPFREEDLWNGYPEETNAPYGIAKKALLVMSQGYRQQYGFNSIFLLPTNMYGPRDNFNEDSSHVIPALIKKCIDAIRNNENEIVVWGTGKPSRDFLYVKDCAEALVLAAEVYNKPEPMNIGTGVEVSIKDLVSIIAKHTGFKGKIIWDATKPDGQPRRCLNTSRAKKELGFFTKTSFEDGLRETIDGYIQSRIQHNSKEKLNR